MADSTTPIHERFPNLIGEINIAWNSAMFSVYTIFLRLMNSDHMRSEAIFFSLKSDSAQRDITAAVGASLLAYTVPTDLEKELSKALDAMGKLAGRRNDAIHSMWVYDFEADSPSLWGPSRPRLIGTEVEATFRNTIHEIYVLASQLSAISDRIAAAHIPKPLERTPALEPKGASSEELGRKA